MAEFVLNELTQNSVISEIREVIQRVLPDWDFDDPNDVGRFLVDLGAAIAERNNSYANTLANETFIQTVRDPDRATLLAHILRYRSATAQPSKVLVSFELSAAHTSDIVIPPYALKLKSRETADGSKFFENFETIVIPASETTITDAVFIEGATTTVNFTSDGLDFQSFTLPEESVIIDELPGENLDYGVDVNSTGESDWVVVNSLVLSDSTDAHFVLRPTLEGLLSINFGDGANGQKPAQGEAITVNYRVGGGSEVTVAGRVSIFVDITGGVLPGGLSLIEIINNAASYSGSDREAVEHIRRAAPLIGDYEIALMKTSQLELAAETLTGVARARVTIAGAAIQVAVVPNGGGQPSTELLATVEQYFLDPPKLAIGYSLGSIAPTYKENDLEIIVWSPIGTDKNLVDSLVRTAINKRLDSLTVDEDGNYVNAFGASLKLADLGFTLKEIGEDTIYDHEVVTPSADVTLNPQNVLTATHTKSSLTVSGHNGGNMEFTAGTIKSLAKIVRIQFLAASGTDISSVLTDNSEEGTPALDYVVTPGTDPEQASLSAITAFINADPNLILADGAVLDDGEVIIGATKLLVVTEDTDTTDHTAFTYGPTFLSSTSTTHFDVTVNVDS